MGGERVGGSDGRVPGDEDPDLHEGSTGCQDSGGEVLLLLLMTATATAATAARIRRGEKRFTGDQSMTADGLRGLSCEPHDRPPDRISLSCFIRGSVSAWESWWAAAESEQCEGDERLGSVELERDPGE
jgi:hypothetical protein